MPTKEPIIVLGLTGTVDTIAERTEALEAAGLSNIRYVAVNETMSAADRHNALVDLAHEIRDSQPTARFIVLKDSVRPLPGAKPMVDGAISFGPVGVRTVKDLKQAARDVRALEVSVAPTAKQPKKPATPAIDLGVFPPDHEPAGFPHWSPFAAAKAAKKATPQGPKPKILALYYQPCNGTGIVTNPKAEITHVMVVPKDLQHTEFLSAEDNALPMLDRKKLGALQASKHAKPTFLKEMTTHFGESFWSNKKFDTAIATTEELESFMQKGGYDGVVVIGDADRKHYALLPQNVPNLLQEMVLNKTPFMRTVSGSDDFVNQTRAAISDVVADCKKASDIKPHADQIVSQALEKAAASEATQVHARVRVKPSLQRSAAKALQPTRPATARSRYDQPHVLVIYGTDVADSQIHAGSANIEMDRVILADLSKTGTFVNPDGRIQNSAFALRETPLDFVADARARFGELFQRSVKGVISTTDQLSTYLSKRRPHGSARETRSYDEIVLVGNVPENFSITIEAIQAACAPHKNNKDEPCKFSRVSSIEALHERFPAQTIERALGIS